MNSLDGKVVAMTGAGGGIGRACAILAAAEGARVVVNDVGLNPANARGSDPRYAQQTVDEITAQGGTAIASFADISSMEGGASIVRDAVNTWGRIDGLVNLAAVQREHTIFQLSEDDWDDVVRINLKGHFTTIKAVASIMRRQRSGRIINFTSTAGLRGRVGAGPYGVTKAAIFGMTRVWSRELGRYGITVNSISPGASAGSRLAEVYAANRMEVLAELEVDGMEDAEVAFREFRAKLASPEVSGPEKVAPMVAYLLSDAAAGINGQTFHVARGNVGLVGEMFPPYRNVAFPDGDVTVERIRAAIGGLMAGVANPTPPSDTILNTDLMGEPLG